MLHAAAADGIELLAGTPHVRADYPTSADDMENALAAVQQALKRDAAIEARGGAEIALDQLEGIEFDELRRFGLAGNPSYLLLEFPYQGWPLDLADRIFRLQVAGVTPVLAHPERNAEVQADPARLAPFVVGGALVQLTAASVDGRGGRIAARAARMLLDAGLAHLIASDAHAPGVRAIGLSGAVEALGDGALADWLTHGIPEAIVVNGSLPPRPSASGKRRRWWSARD